MRTRLTLFCLFINFILVGCAGMPIMGKQSIPVPKSQSLADQEFKKQNKEVKGAIEIVTTEEDVFKFLDYPYSTPEERDI